MPFLCDLIGFAVLILGAWWIRKLGALTIVGLIATLINLSLGTGMQFLGFLAASVFFDVVMAVIGYDRALKKPTHTVVSMTIVATASATVAGTIIGAVFMTSAALTRWGGVAGWAGLHMIGGVIGGIIGTALVLALKKRGMTVYSESQTNAKPKMVTK